MPKLSSKDYESHLRTRHRVALAFAQGDLGGGEYGDAVKALGVSLKTLKRDISRVRSFATFEDWRPKKRGPPKGQRHVEPGVFAVVQEHVYSNGHKKLNVAKLGRDLDHKLYNGGWSAVDVPSPSTLERLVKDIEAADPAHFATQRHGRAGRRDYSLQVGSLETSRPLEIICIDHTPLDHRTFALGDEEVSVRTTATAALDVHTGVCLAAFISLFPPSATTAALAMAMAAAPKTDLLRAYGIPGEWEAGGLGETLYVDGAAELTSDAIEFGCKRHNMELRVGWPGRPERRAHMERFWRTLNSEVHSWDGTTLSNTEELKAHGGQKAPMWNLEEVQRRFLIAIMEYNNETYGGPKIPLIMQWRDQVSRVAVNRRISPNPSDIFIDFLPYKTSEITFEGIRFANCFYRSGELAKLRYDGVKSTIIHYDPRNVSQLWIEVDRGYVAIPRVYPARAPVELFALRHWGRKQAQKAQEKKDSKLLRQLAAAKEKRLDQYGFAEASEFWKESTAAVEALAEGDATWLAPMADPAAPPVPSDQPSSVDPLPNLGANFSIPLFKPRLK